MLVPLNTFEWQVLRAVLRSKKPPAGAELRLVPSRRTRDGTFLDALVGLGLLAVADAERDADRAGNPPQFRARYTLTAAGRRAAEYGEYEKIVGGRLSAGATADPGTAALRPPADPPDLREPTARQPRAARGKTRTAPGKRAAAPRGRSAPRAL